mgnify:CR=1 FL=1
MLMSTAKQRPRDRRQEAADAEAAHEGEATEPCSAPEPLPSTPLFCAGCGFRIAAHPIAVEGSN